MGLFLALNKCFLLEPTPELKTASLNFEFGIINEFPDHEK
jgi:hypothetical protein